MCGFGNWCKVPSVDTWRCLHHGGDAFGVLGRSWGTVNNGSRRIGILALDTFLQDVRYAGRMWRKSPAFTLFAVCGLAFAIGANTAVFTIVNAILFRNLSFPGSERIAYLSSLDKAHGDDDHLEVIWYPYYRDFEVSLRLFEVLAA